MSRAIVSKPNGELLGWKITLRIETDCPPLDQLAPE